MDMPTWLQNTYTWAILQMASKQHLYNFSSKWQCWLMSSQLKSKPHYGYKPWFDKPGDIIPFSGYDDCPRAHHVINCQFRCVFLNHVMWAHDLPCEMPTLINAVLGRPNLLDMLSTSYNPLMPFGFTAIWCSGMCNRIKLLERNITNKEKNNRKKNYSLN